jgi:hypothetical protein
MLELARAGKDLQSQQALDAAESALRLGEQNVEVDIAPLVLQLRVLGEALYQSIKMKLSVPLYGVCVDRRLQYFLFV